MIDIHTPEFLNGPRVRPHEVEGMRVWVKRPEPRLSNYYILFQRLVRLLMPCDMLRPTRSMGGGAALIEEAARLKLWAQAGFHVPQLLGVSEQVMVTQDAGVELKAYLHQADEGECWARLQQAAGTLGELHGHGFAHGRPYLKDFVWDAAGQQIGFLDLEENPINVMSLADAQARDIWLFLGSCADIYPHHPTEKLVTLYNVYAQQAGEAHRPRLRRLIRWLSPLRRLVEQSGGAKAGKDIARALAATRALEEIFAQKSA